MNRATQIRIASEVRRIARSALSRKMHSEGMIFANLHQQEAKLMIDELVERDRDRLWAIAEQIVALREEYEA